MAIARLPLFLCELKFISDVWPWWCPDSNPIAPLFRHLFTHERGHAPKSCLSLIYPCGKWLFFSFYFTWSVVQVIKNFIALSANSLWMVKRNFLQVYKMPECFSQWVLLWVWRAVSLYVYARVYIYMAWYIHGLHLWAIIVLWCITNQQKRANINCRFRFFVEKKNS